MCQYIVIQFSQNINQSSFCINKFNVRDSLQITELITFKEGWKMTRVITFFYFRDSFIISPSHGVALLKLKTWVGWKKELPLQHVWPKSPFLVFS